MLANSDESAILDDPRSQRGARRRAGRRDEKKTDYVKFGLVLGSEKLSSFLGGVKLLEMLMLFLAAHTTSFPRWPGGADELTIGWRWAIGEYCS